MAYLFGTNMRKCTLTISSDKCKYAKNNKENHLKGKRWKVHAIFDCLDCGKRWENYLTAQNSAKKHAEKHKHNVIGEVGLAVRYYGKTQT